MCDQRERLMDYFYDEAAPADRQVVETHLESCADCRDEMRAFRRVREDLLAWEVPAYESVWTPFAPEPVVPWYQQVPAWAMTAAAGLMFVLGTAGGFAAQALGGDPMPAAPAPVQTAALTPVVVPPAPPAAVMPAGLSDDEIVALVRREMARVSLNRDVVTSQAEALVAEASRLQWGRLQEYLITVSAERDLERKSTEQTLGALRSQVSDLQAAVAILVSQQSKGQQ